MGAKISKEVFARSGYIFILFLLQAPWDGAKTAFAATRQKGQVRHRHCSDKGHMLGCSLQGSDCLIGPQGSPNRGTWKELGVKGLAQVDPRSLAAPISPGLSGF